MLSSLTGLDLTKQEDMLLFVSTQTTEFQNSQTGDQPYSDNSAYGECSLVHHQLFECFEVVDRNRFVS